MLHLFAQSTPPGGAAETIDKLARTPISQIVLFVAAATVLRVLIHLYTSRIAQHQRTGLYTVAKVINETIDAIVYALIFVFLLIRPFGVQAFRIPSGSMLETLQIHDFIVANKAVYRYSEPKVGDIVVFKPPQRAKFHGQDDVDFIKRLIGTPGQIIEIRDGVLYRDGQAVKEPYVSYLHQPTEFTYRKLSPEEIRERPKVDFKLVKHEGKLMPLAITPEHVNNGLLMPSEYMVGDQALMDRLRELPAEPIPQGYFLMMGDNRYHSYDGRFWGLVPRESIIGRAEFIWFPFSRWRGLR